MFIRMYVCVSVRVHACVAVVCYFVCARSARAWCSWVHQLARTKRGTLVELSNHGEWMQQSIARIIKAVSTAAETQLSPTMEDSKPGRKINIICGLSQQTQPREQDNNNHIPHLLPASN